MINKLKDIKLAIIGLGYVGLPLALEFSKKRFVIAFDTNEKRIKELKNGIDRNLEFDKKQILKNKKIIFTDNQNYLSSCNCFIITVPTPVNRYKKPDLGPIIKATRMVGKILKKGDLVIYESTVYPGCIEEECVKRLEKLSKLLFNYDFFCGYSPERINPGDKKYNITNIKKITSGSNYKVANLVDRLYNEIIAVGTHKAPSIKVAEAAKVIENTQRDLNIALINEFSIIFNKLGLNTNDVLNAAGSKWNFLKYKPGLVGGHCIGVDPYYLTYKAKKIGYTPNVILAGRSINDNMGIYASKELLKKMKLKNIEVRKSKILVMGLTFKENCADIRNSGVQKLIFYLIKKGCKIDLYDPWSNMEDVKNIYDILPIKKLNKNTYSGIIIAVAHDIFKKIEIKSLCKKNSVIFDLKSIYPREQVDLSF